MLEKWKQNVLAEQFSLQSNNLCRGKVTFELYVMKFQIFSKKRHRDTEGSAVSEFNV